MNLIRLCMSRPVGVSVAVLLLTLFGLLSLFRIPIQLTPTVDLPVITVATSWPGANPQEIEREIVDRQEEQLRSTKGLRRMTSESRDNQGAISLEFYLDVDKSEALREVSEKLRQVSGYPPEVEEPAVALADADMSATIAWLIVRKTDPNIAPDDDSITFERDFVENHVQPYLDRVKGVASTDIYGGREREVQVSVDAGLLAARGLTFRQLETALRLQNANISAGTRTQGKRDYAVRTVGQYESTAEILDTVIAYTPGGPVYVRNVATAKISHKRPASMVRSKGQFALAIPVRREVGANVMQVMQRVREAIARINQEVFKARKLEIELLQVYDETVYIDQAIGMVQSNAVFGGLLTVGVLLFFLRNWRATAVATLSIPISLVGTFVVLAALGRTLNVISLAGLAFAIGSVVDASIVVLENIYRHRQTGKDIFDAVRDGASEVWAAVLAGSLTNVAVFLPVIFIAEEAGQLFRDISLSTVVAVLLSLVVAITVIPPLALRLLGGARARRFGTETIDGAAAAPDGAPQNANATPKTVKPLAFANLMAAIVARVNGAPVTRLALIIGLTVGSLALTPLLIPEPTYLPAGNRNLVFGFLVTPPGYSIDEFRRMANVIEESVSPYWKAKPGSAEYEKLSAQWRQMVEGMLATNTLPDLQTPGLSWLERDRVKREWLTPPPLIDNFFFVCFNGGCFMGAASQDANRVKPLTRLLTMAGTQIPGTYAIFLQMPLFRFGSGNDVALEIRGDNLDQVTAAADAVFMECMRRFGSPPQAAPSNFNLGRPEVRIVPDRERAADMGLNVTDVGFIVEAAVDGAYVGDFRDRGGDTIDIVVLVKDQRDRTTQEIGQIPIYTPAGRIVPLLSAARLTDTTALEQINRSERQRAVTLTIRPPESVPLETVIRQLRDEVEPQLRQSGRIDPSIVITMAGNADKLETARAEMIGEWKGWTFGTLLNLIGSRFFLSVLVVYLLMVALYESWLYPLVIMFSVPLALFGGFLGLWVCHAGTLLTTDQPVQQLDVLTFLGFVILVGIVVNNAILLVDQSLQNMRGHGMDPHDAIREAVRARVRPVLMTSLTNVIGQLPLAVMPGAGSELYRGLAAVQVGGMFVSTLGTLVLVPSVLGLVMDIRMWFARRRGQVLQAPAPNAAPPAVAPQEAGGGAEPLQALQREP